MSKFCTNCGTKLDDNVKFCTSCGKAVEGEEQANQSNATVVVNNNSVNEPNNGLAIAGFVVSLVSTFLCCGAFNVVGLVLSIVGLVKAKDYNGKGKGLAIAGIVICGVVMILGIIFYIVMFAAETTTGAYDWSSIVSEIESI